MVVDENIEVHNRIKTNSLDDNRLVVQKTMAMKRQFSDKIDLSKNSPTKGNLLLYRSSLRISE